LRVRIRNVKCALCARHRPEDTALYSIVRDHLEVFLDEAREKHERGLPRYVEQALF
jgi:hypothetical protein